MAHFCSLKIKCLHNIVLTLFGAIPNRELELFLIAIVAIMPKQNVHNLNIMCHNNG